MIARKQTPLQLFLVVTFVNQITAENFQPAFPLPDFFPQIRRHIAVGIRWVSLGSVIAFIERQELRLRTFQPRCHADFTAADGKVNHRPARERQQRFRVLSLRLRITVQPVLIDRIVDALGEIGFQFDRGDRDSVQEQHQIDAVLIGRGILHLLHHSQAIGTVTGHDVGIHGISWFELSHPQRTAKPQHIKAVPNDVQRSLLIERIPESAEQMIGSRRSMILQQHIPSVWLRLLHPCQHILRKQAQPTHETRITLIFVNPATGFEVFADLGLEIALMVKTHATSGIWVAKLRTSILPVTAAEIRAVRRSCSKSIPR